MQNNIRTDFKTILRYIIPSVGGLAVVYLYVIVDGIFVGRGVGEVALAAINIACPFVFAVSAVSALFNTGGAAITAIRLGRGDNEGARRSFVTALLLSVIVIGVFSVIGVVFAVPISKASGAKSGELLEMTVIYIKYASYFALANSLAYGFSGYVRNDGNPALAFWGMAVGALTNIFLDWLFVYPMQMGMTGAAIASGAGQVLSVAVMSFHFIKKKGILKLNFKYFTPNLTWKVIKRGLPDFISQLASPVTLLCYNFVILDILGEDGVAAYSALGYICSLMFGILSGVSQGIQPLIGRSYGAKDKKALKYFFKRGLILNLGLSATIYIILVLCGDGAVSIFNENPDLVRTAADALPLFGFSTVIASFNMMIITYFFSTKETGKAVVISACRGLILNVICIFLVPRIFGNEAVWGCVTTAEGICAFVAAIFYGVSVHKSKKNQSIA